MDTDNRAGTAIRVLIVDDHAVVRQGLRTFLELSNRPPAGEEPPPAIRVVAEAANGIEAIEMARATQPDVILLDLVMPELDGLQAIAKIRESSPASRILILTSFAEDDRILPAIQAGAQGYLLKDIAPQALAPAIRGAFAGDVQRHEWPPDRHLAAGIAGLTDRELEVIGLIAAGLSNRAIAERLVVSEKTVKTHVGNILNKLNLEDRTQAAIYAIRHGLGAEPD